MIEETVQSKLSRELRAGGVVALLPGQSSAEAQALLPEIVRYLEAQGLRLLIEPPGPEGVALLLSLGGDGLMMRAARRYPNVPILGINFGHLGFLTAAEASHWREAIDRVLAGDFQIREGPTLATTVRSKDGQDQAIGWAVNDVVVHGGLRFIHPTLFIDRQYVNEYPGDGMVVATPAGSTAYCMAAGGPVLLSGVGGLALVPISCHSPIRVSLVVPADVEIGLKLIGRNGADLILDGQSEQLRPIKPGDTVFVRRGSASFCQISFRSFDWFAAFQSKFNYQIRRGGLIPTVPEDGGIGVRLGYTTWSMQTVPAEDSIPLLRGIGFDSIELTVVPGWRDELDSLTPARRQRVKQLLAEHELALPALAGHRSLVATDPAEHDENWRRLTQTIDLAVEWATDEGPPVIDTTAGAKAGQWNAVKDRLVDRLGKLSDYAAERGVAIAIEPHVSSALDTPERVHELLAAVGRPNLRITFDISHFNVQGIPIEESVAKLAGVTAFTHIKDERGVGPSFEFLIPGEGEFDYARYLRAMHAHGYRGDVHVEISLMVQRRPGFDPVAAAQQSYDVVSRAFEAAGVPRARRKVGT